jgi:AcrR family transcriptional regulator
MCYKIIMPKIVDPVQRREAIADALFAIVADRGFAKISLRAIAEESGLAIGSIRHYFTTAEGIVRFALETLVERVSARLEDRLASLLPRLESGALGRDEAKEETVDLLAELLPLDEIRRRESVVWLAFEEAARTDPALSDVFETSARGSRQLMARTVESMSRRGVLRADLDLELEVDLLAALVDGLTLRSTLHPEVLAPERAREVLAAHLEGLRRGSD